MVLPQFLNPGGTKRSVVLPGGGFLSPGGPSVDEIGYRPIRNEGEFTLTSLAGFRFVGDPLAFAPGDPLYTVEQVFRLLGYSTKEAELIRRGWAFNEEISEGDACRVGEIVARLACIDTAIEQASLDSSVIETCKTKLNWSGHLTALRGEGHQLLKELALIFDLRLCRSRYAKQSSHFVSYR